MNQWAASVGPHCNPWHTGPVTEKGMLLRGYTTRDAMVLQAAQSGMPDTVRALCAPLGQSPQNTRQSTRQRRGLLGQVTPPPASRGDCAIGGGGGLT